MAPAGFIHDKLDIKILILYILSRTATPVRFSALMDLVMCDPGVDYFQFAEASSELLESGHICLEEGLYTVTEKGRRNSVDGESSLSPVIRQRCDQRLETLNQELRLRTQVKTSVETRGNGEYVLHLSLDDGFGNLLSLNLLTASKGQCTQMAQHFRSHPEQVYHGIIETLLDLGEGTPS